MRQLLIELDALDIIICLSRPDAEIGLVRVKPVLRRLAALQDDSTRMMLGASRGAKEPPTIRGVVRKVMEACGINTADKVVVDTMNVRVASSLRKLLHRGKLVVADWDRGCDDGSC